MNRREFAQLLVDTLVNKDPLNVDAGRFHRENGINPNRLDDATEIFKVFMRYNLETGGVRNSLVVDRWNKVKDSSIIKRVDIMVDSIRSIRKCAAYFNLSTNCPVSYAKNTGFTDNVCMYRNLFKECPVVLITNEITWHRKHIRLAKAIAESIKRLLIESIFSIQDNNINTVYSTIVDRHSNNLNSKSTITDELLSQFHGIKELGVGAKSIIWMLSDLSSPTHQLNHWPMIDQNKLIPVDTHVQRLTKRFGFVPSRADNTTIQQAILSLYPEEPRKMDIALFRLGGDSEEAMCKKVPNCSGCFKSFPQIHLNCPARKGSKQITLW